MEEVIMKEEREIDTLRMQLAGCGVAAMQNTQESVRGRITADSPYWSASYGDVCRAVDREMELRQRVDELEAKLALTCGPVLTSGNAEIQCPIKDLCKGLPSTELREGRPPAFIQDDNEGD
jgi:hypothetical protein